MNSIPYLWDDIIPSYMLDNMHIENERTSLQVMERTLCPISKYVNCSQIMERVSSYRMGRWARDEDQKIVMEVSVSDADFLDVVEGLDGRWLKEMMRLSKNS